MTALYERAKGGGHGQNMTTQKEEEGNALLLKFFFFMTLHKVPYKCKLFFFAPLFRQSNVQNGEKLVYWSIWTTF